MYDCLTLWCFSLPASRAYFVSISSISFLASGFQSSILLSSFPQQGSCMVLKGIEALSSGDLQLFKQRLSKTLLDFDPRGPRAEDSVNWGLTLELCFILLVLKQQPSVSSARLVTSYFVFICSLGIALYLLPRLLPQFRL